MWRVFWVPQDAVRTGVRRRVLAGWEDLPAREDAAGVQAGRSDLPVAGLPGRSAAEPVCSVGRVPAVHGGDAAELRDGHRGCC